jgi:flagellar biosynthesis/type III secretory pathway protein FliH
LKNLVAAVIRFEHPANGAALVELIELLNEWLDSKPELKRIFAIWIRAVLLRQSKHALVLPQVNHLKELKMSLAERFDEWAKEHEQKGMAEGIEKGIEKGEVLLLQRQLVRRFGALPNEVVNQIATAASGQIETWGDRVLDAATLDEVFRQ